MRRYGKIWKFTLIITPLPGHSPSGQSLKGRVLTSKSNAWRMEEAILACVNAETLVVSGSMLQAVLYFTSRPLISLLSLKIWIKDG